jgi:hypothetical protein
VADFSKDGGLHQPDIPATENADFHEEKPCGGVLERRRRLMVSTPITSSMTPKVFDTVNVSLKNGSAAARAYASTSVRLSRA